MVRESSRTYVRGSLVPVIKVSYSIPVLAIAVLKNLFFEISKLYFKFQKNKIKLQIFKKDWRKFNLFSCFNFREKISKIFSVLMKKEFLKRFLFFWAKEDFLKRFWFFWAKKDFRKKILFSFFEKRFRKKNLLPKSVFVRTRKELLRKDSFADPWFELIGYN